MKVSDRAQTPRAARHQSFVLAGVAIASRSFGPPILDVSLVGLLGEHLRRSGRRFPVQPLLAGSDAKGGEFPGLRERLQRAQ
jgi:hypothetical protein